MDFYHENPFFFIPKIDLCYLCFHFFIRIKNRLNMKYLSRFYLLLCVALVMIPLAVIVMAWGEFNSEIWTFLLEHQLPLLLKNTLFLAIGVGLGVAFLGTSAAWFTAMYRFPLHGFFFWALMLPLAMPAYVLAFTWLGFFDYSSPVSTLLREQYEWENGLPEIRNVWGLIAVMSLTFYPYVYLLARNAFVSMGQRALEAGASLGLSPMQAWWKVALPMARPWIAGGTLLALMEVLADFGTVSIFAYESFTTAIYEAWFSFFSLETAKQLAAILITFVFVLVALEQISRGKRRFERTGKAQITQRKNLLGWQKWAVFFYCSMLLLLAFIAPLIQLFFWANQTWTSVLDDALWSQAMNSFAGAMMAAVVVATVALFLGLAKRYERGTWAAVAAKLATLGYAIPGTVLSVGVFVPIAGLDNVLIETFTFPEGTTGILKGTLIVMILAYLIRFLAVGYAVVEAGLERISPNQTESARSLGCGNGGVLWRVYLPMLKGTLATAMLMTFVDVMKEMPITLMMRPYNWETLAVKIYSFTSEGQYAEAALPALLIIATGLLPVILFSRAERTS